MKSLSSERKTSAFLVRPEEKDDKENEIEYLYQDLKIGVIMPAYNEEKNIARTLSQFPSNISKNFDIIVIDDGSKDRTILEAQKYNVIIIQHRKNKGNGAAIQTGLEFLRQNDYDIGVIVDADGQHQPKDINKFIDPIYYGGVDFVIGNRFEFYYNMSVVKKLLSRAMSVFYTILLQKRVSDPTMGYRALSKKVIRNLSFESEYSITQEMLFKIIPNYTFHEVATKIYEREYGESFISIKTYLKKTIFSVIKFYLFPKFKKIFNRVLNRLDVQKVNHLMRT